VCFDDQLAPEPEPIRRGPSASHFIDQQSGDRPVIVPQLGQGRAAFCDFIWIKPTDSSDGVQFQKLVKSKQCVPIRRAVVLRIAKSEYCNRLPG
jgi:hypothetical protein